MFFGAADQGQIAVDLLTSAIDSGDKSSEVTDTPLILATKDNIDQTVEEHPICYEELLDQAKQMS